MGDRGWGIGDRGWLALALIASAAAPLAKVPGLAVGVSVGVLLASQRHRRAAIAAGLAALFGLVPYAAYGAAANWPVFRAVALEQGARAAGLEVLSRLTTSNWVVSANWRDSWMPCLWLALAYATFRRDRLLAALAGPYLVVLVAAVDEATLPGWYREPLFPGLCLAGAVFVRDALARPNALRAILLLFGVTFGKLAEAFDAWEWLSRTPLGTRSYPLLVAGLAGLAFAGLLWPSRLARRISGLVAGGAVAVAVVASVVVVVRADELYPAYRPPGSLEYDARTQAGLVLTRYSVEPTAIPPGGWVRVWTSWYAARDAGSVSLSTVVRPYDRKTRASGTPVALGDPLTVVARAGEQPTAELLGPLPATAGPGDYEVLVRVADEPVSLGVVRVREGAGGDQAYQTVGRPATFDGALALDRAALGQPRSMPTGTAYPVLLRLEPLRPLGADYYVFVHATDAAGRRVAQSDGLPAGRRGDGWHVGDAVDDWRDLLLSARTPPGRYYLTAGLYEMASGRRLRTAWGDSVPLGAVDVGPPLAEEIVPNRLGAKLAGGVELLGYGLERRAEALGLVLYWRASGPVPRDYTVFVHLVDASGQLRAQTDGQPDQGRLPTSTWRAGQVVADPRALPLSGVPPGRYRVLAGLYLAPDGPRLAVEGRPDGAAEVAAIELP